MSLRIIIADDESLMRSGLTLLLGAAKDIEIVAEATNGEEAVALSRELAPDLILMDLRMPVMDGLAATRTLMAQADRPEVLVLTAFGTDEFVHEALRAGAAGYILKDTPPDELINAVRAAAGGTRTLSPGVMDSLLDQARSADGRAPQRQDGVPTAGSSTGRDDAFLAGAFGRSTGQGGPGSMRNPAQPNRPDPLAALTAREREIAEAVASGMTNAQVARSLFVSTATVKTHLARIFDKLEVSTRVQLALLVNESR